MCDIEDFVVPYAHCYQYSLSLQLFGQNNKIQLAKADNNKNPEERCADMFRQWLIIERNATWNKVIAALRAVNLGIIANDVERMLDHRVSNLLIYML